MFMSEICYKVKLGKTVSLSLFLHTCIIEWLTDEDLSGLLETLSDTVVYS